MAAKLGRPIRTAPGEKLVRTVCLQQCGIGCTIMAHVKDGVLQKVEPGDFPPTSHICARGLSSVKLVYHPDRLKYPLMRAGARGGGQWRRVTWDEALEGIAARLAEIGDRHGPASRAWILGGMGLIFTTAITGLPGACGGTFILPGGCGDSAGQCADIASYGSALWYGDDYTTLFESPGLCLMWGSNAAETEPLKWRRIREARDRGARLVVIDPRFTVSASRADEWVPIRPGTDAALALGMMHVVLDRGLEDRAFLSRHTSAPFLVRADNGQYLREKDMLSGGSDRQMVRDASAGMVSDTAPAVVSDTAPAVVSDTAAAEARDRATSAVRRFDEEGVSPALRGRYQAGGIEASTAYELLVGLVEQYPPSRASAITGVPADTIVRLAVEYATRKPAASYRGMGCTRSSLYGDLSFRAITALAALTGNISLEGHRPFGVNFAAFMTRGAPNLMPLMVMNQAIITGKPWPIKSLWMAKTNLVNMNPDFNRFIRELAPRLELIVAADMFMTTSAQYADFVLPAASWFEYTDVMIPVGNGAPNYLQLQQQAIEPLYECRSNFDMLAALARKMGLEGFMQESAEECVRMVLETGHPSMEGITLERLKEGPAPPAPQDVPDFGTASGRLDLYIERLTKFGQELPVHIEPLETGWERPDARYPLTLISAHPRLRSNSTFGNIGWLRELDPRPVLEISPADAGPREITDGDPVRVYNDRGEARLRARLTQGIRPGSVNICQGWSPSDFDGGTYQALTHAAINPAQMEIGEPNAALNDTAVQVEKAGG